MATGRERPGRASTSIDHKHPETPRPNELAGTARLDSAHPVSPGSMMPLLDAPSRSRLVRFLVASAVALPLLRADSDSPPAIGPTRADVLATMQRATRFMVDEVSCEGGYVWSYLPDFSRRWGELEARPSMIWIQGPGTPEMGRCFLEAWKVTGEAMYHEAARRAAGALIRSQLACGGWNYVADFAGEESLRAWYATVGRNAWRLEEFQHYFGNATFDDSTTVSAARFLLRLHLARPDPEVKAALDRAIAFVLTSQHTSGAWPQRFPPADESDASDAARYSSYLTFNDDVTSANIEFLLECHRALGDSRLLDPIRRGMDAFVLLQQPAPQAGWALQYTPDDLQPAGARSYEPRAIVTHTTASNVEQLLHFHALTGDPKYLARIPEALAWLDSCRLPAGAVARGTHPTFIEVGTGRPLYLHREGSNVVNGRYFVDSTPGHPVGHYSSYRTIDVDRLRERYEAARLQPPRGPAASLFLNDDPAGADDTATAAQVARILAHLDDKGRWLTPLRTTSHAYRGDGSIELPSGDFSGTFVGDDTDTSPFTADEPTSGISTRTYLRNMAVLIAWLREQDSR